MKQIICKLKINNLNGKGLVLISTFMFLLAIWILFFSDIKRGGVLSINDIVNIAFFFVSATAIVYAFKCFDELSTIYTILNKAEVSIDESLNTQFNKKDILTLFSGNGFLCDRYEEYLKESSEQDRINPNNSVCSIENYIGRGSVEEHIHCDLLNQIPGSLTGLGMLGTFIGLTLGLNNFEIAGNATDIAESIEPLMACIQLAFITSIYGLVLSIVFNFVYRKTIEDANIVIDSFASRFDNYFGNSDNTAYNLFLSSQLKQNSCIENAGISIASSVNVAVDKSMEKLIDTYVVACKGLENAQIKGMDILVDKFTEKVTKSISDKLTEICDLIDLTSTLFDETTEKVKENVSLAADLAQNAKGFLETYEKTTKVYDSYSENIYKMQSSMNENVADLMKSVEKNTATTRETVNELKKATAIIEPIEELTKKTTEALASFEKFGPAIDEYREKLESQFNQQVTNLDMTGKSLLDRIEKCTSGITSTEKEIKEQISSINDMIQTFDGEIRPLYNDQLEGLRDIEETITRNIGQAASQYALSEERILRSGELTRNNLIEGEQAMRSFEKTMNDYERELKKVSTEIPKLVKSLEKKKDERD